MKILITGSHCVGKTTLLNELKEQFPQFDYFEETVRRIENIKVNENGDDASQYAIMDLCLKDLKHKVKSFAFYDRGSLDCYVYTQYLYIRGNISIEALKNIEKQFLNSISQYDFIVFLRPQKEIKMEDDGYRSTSVIFQKDIDKLFDTTLERYEIPHLTLSGNHTQKLNTLKNILNLRN